MKTDASATAIPAIPAIPATADLSVAKVAPVAIAINPIRRAGEVNASPVDMGAGEEITSAVDTGGAI